jgi:glucose dehydrogenase
MPALGDRVFMVTDNAHLIALGRDKGQLLWDVEMADSRAPRGRAGRNIHATQVQSLWYLRS